MSEGPPPRLPPLLSKDSDLRSPRVFVDGANHADALDKGRAGRERAAIPVDEQHAIEGDLIADLCFEPVDGDDTAFLDPELSAASLNNRVHTHLSRRLGHPLAWLATPQTRKPTLPATGV